MGPAADPRLGGERLETLDPAALVARWGSPLWVYDLDVVRRRAAALWEALPDGVSLAYAVKANPALAVVGSLVRAGLGLDVATAGEMAVAGAACADPTRLVVTGPGKTDADLAAAVGSGAGLVTIESVEEIDRLAAAVRAGGSGRQRILFRAWVDGSGEGAPILAGAAKFGMTRDELAMAAHRAVAFPELEPVGLHAFGASNVTDADALGDHADRTVALALWLARTHRFAVQVVDVGGGLGIPYADDEPELDRTRLARRLAGAVAAVRRDPMGADATLLLEPGRWLVGPAGAYVTTVVATKPRDAVVVAVLDGGIHGLLRPALVGTPHRSWLVRRVTRRGEAAGDEREAGSRGGADGRDPTDGRDRADGRDGTGALDGAGVRDGTGGRAATEAAGEAVALVGPLCTGLDVLDAGAVLPRPRPGDLVAFLDAGAYGFTESMPLFLSHPRPAEVAASGGRVACIRPRVEAARTLEGQADPFADGG
jgi:diaminopimelate decarboxylase